VTGELGCVILAGGSGSRMQEDGVALPKLLMKIDGATLLDHAVKAARSISSDVSVVLDQHFEQLASVCIRLGVAHVVAVGSSPSEKVLLASRRSASLDLMVVSADTFSGRASLRMAVELYRSSGADSVLIVAEQQDLTDSQWSVVDDPVKGRRIRSCDEGSSYERVAWIFRREIVSASPRHSGEQPTRSQSGFETGSVNWLFEDLRLAGVRSLIFEMTARVVNVNRRRDLKRARSLLRYPGIQ
jgi:GTP:adenosylcobinamide-phosphate guanylyltransferase